MNDQSPEKPTLDLTKIKALMDSGGGPRFWRSLDELAETEEFRSYLEDEFPDRTPDWKEPAKRRTFLKVMGASLGLAGLTACTKAIPEHIGLGSGTQLAIGVGVALAGLYRLDLPARAVATLYQRGQRSGIGVGAFEQGGFLVDGGKDAGVEPPPIVSRLEFPADWRVVLLLDPAVQGLHGEREIAAFQSLPEFPESKSARLCRLMFTQALPALAEQSLDKFGRAIGELQRVVGDYFAPAQGGRFSSPRVAEALAWMESQGITGIGQSSWGPTGFAIVGDGVQASALVHAAQARWGGPGRLQFMVCSGRNRGGEIELVPLARASADTK